MRALYGGSQLRLGAAFFLLAGLSIAQNVIPPSEIPCSEETLKPNLELANKTRVAGRLKDATGAPFSNSKIILRVSDLKGKFVPYRSISTNQNGQFDFGIIDAGKYRFLPAPNRGFKQPKRVACHEGRDCSLILVLETNPTDQPYAGCPIR